MRRRLAQGQTSWIERSGAPCSSPDEVATHQTFSILMPITKAPPGGQGCHYKDPNATVQGSRAAAFLFLSGSAVFVLRAKEKRDILSALGFREGMGGCLHWPWAPPSGNLEILVPMFFLQTTYYANRL